MVTVSSAPFSLVLCDPADKPQSTTLWPMQYPIHLADGVDSYALVTQRRYRGGFLCRVSFVVISSAAIDSIAMV